MPQLDPRLIIPLLSIQNPVNFQNNIEWNSRADLLLEQQEQTTEIEQKMTEQVNQILGSQLSDSPWKKILSSLKPRLQLDFLRRLINQRHPNVYDWRNLFIKIEYQFQYSSHYRLVLAMGLIASFFAISEMILLVFPQPDNWLNGFLGLAISLILVFWISLWNGIEERLEPKTFIQLGLFGLFSFTVQIKRLFSGSLVWNRISLLFLSVSGQGDESAGIVGLFIVCFIFFAIFAGTASVINPGDIAAVTIAVVTATGSAFLSAVMNTGMTDMNANFSAVAVHTTVSSLIAFIGAVALVFISAAFNDIVFASDAFNHVVNATVIAALNAGIASAAGALIEMGLGFWYRAKSQTDFTRFLAIFAFPYFCWFPIVVVFSTLFMLRYLTWQYTSLIWVILLGTCTALWLYGQNKHRKASNPLKGILDVAQ